MSEEKPQKSTPEYQAWKDEFMRKIRERSGKSSSQLRKEYAEKEIEKLTQDATRDTVYARLIKEHGGAVPYFLSINLANPDLGTQTLEDYFAYHAKEDAERDKNMITSADLLNLHLSELNDYLQSGIGGFHSRKTDTLLHKVTTGLLWILDIQGQRERVDNPHGGFGFLYWHDKLKQAKDDREKMILINSTLGAVHAHDTGGDPKAGNILIRDLRYGDRRDVTQLLAFFSNDLG